MKKKLKIIIPIAVVFVIAAICVTVFLVKNNKFELIESEVTCELGSSLDETISNYVNCGNSTMEENATIDFSKVDINKPGEYSVVVKYKNKELTFKVMVTDTTKPVIESKEVQETPIVGKEYAVSNFLTSVTDAGGVSDISILEGEKELVKGTDVSAMNLVFDAAGEHTLTISVADTSKNTATKDIKITVLKDYESMVTGFKDWSVTAEQTVDFMEGLEVGAEISSVTPNTDMVDVNTPGEYTLTYTILGDDGVTTFTHDVKVTVTEAKVIKAPSNSSKAPSNNASNNSSSASNQNNSSTYVAQPGYVDSAVQEVVDIVNQRRAENGLAPLAINAAACEAAKVRAAEIVTSFSHTRPDGRMCFTALDEAGLSNTCAGENIAAGQLNSEMVMNSWMNSEGHRANILTPGYNGIGVACYTAPGTTYGIYWVQMFVTTN